MVSEDGGKTFAAEVTTKVTADHLGQDALPMAVRQSTLSPVREHTAAWNASMSWLLVRKGMLLRAWTRLSVRPAWRFPRVVRL
jgi:hypothetical protein